VKTAVKALREMIANLDALIEYQTVMAKLQRSRFKALVKEGFTPDQAIELSKKIF
jgi:hypothetical protein